MGRKNHMPGKEEQTFPYETVSFGSGLIKSTRIPDDAIADGYDIVVHPDEITGREGSELYTSVTIPQKYHYSRTASKTGDLVTSIGAMFSNNDLYDFIVFPGSPDSHYQIIERISWTQVRVLESLTDHSATSGCYVRSHTNLMAWHKIQKKWIFIWGDDVYVANPNIPFLTLCKNLSIDEDLDNSVCTYDDFDDISGIIFNANGMFKIELNLDTPILYKINIPVPKEPMLDDEQTGFSKFNYHYVYSATRLEEDANGNYLNRLTPSIIKLETGSNTWDEGDEIIKDYADVYTDEPIGLGDPNQAYYVLTLGTLSSPYDNVGGWQALAQNGSFVININSIGVNEVVVDFSGVTNMSEVAAVIQSAMRDFFPTATCEFDVDHFVITSGRYVVGTISDYGSGVSATTIDIEPYLTGSGGTSLDGFTTRTPKVVGPLYVPFITGSTTEYQQHLTHFSIYRTKDLLGRYRIQDEADVLNNPNDLVWVNDLRICAAFFGELASAGGGSYYIYSLVYGAFQEYDVGSVLEFEDGSRYEMINYISTKIAYLTMVSSWGTDIGENKAAAIGNGRVFRASQSGNIVTRTHGDIFHPNDDGKIIRWSDGTSEYIIGYISANEMLVSESKSIPSTGMTMEPIYRYYNDITEDQTLETRLTTLKLKQRFWKPMPNGNLGKIVPGLIFTANTDEGQLNYGQIPDALEYLHGFHDPAYQITKKITDGIQALWSFQNILVIWTSKNTWRWVTSNYQYIANPYTRDVVLQITGLDVSDDDTGMYSSGSIVSVGDGIVMLLTSESGKIGWRAYNGYQYGPDHLELESTGKQRIPEIQDLLKTTATLFDGRAGLMLFGKE